MTAWGHVHGRVVAGFTGVVHGGVCMDVGRKGAREGLSWGRWEDDEIRLWVARRGLRLRVTLN